LFRPIRCPRLVRERLATPDGDFLDLDWLAGAPSGRPLVLVLHGLEGSARSHYAAGLLRESARAGLAAAVLHFRSCSGELNRRARMYHSGDTADLEWVVGELTAREPARPLALVGMSLGANVALKWLGERGEAAPPTVTALAAISTPFDLRACAEVLDRGWNRRLYTRNFLRTLKAKVRAKAGLLDGQVDLTGALAARTFAEYDRAVTAPLYGFADERDYWTRSSSGAYLPRIRRPCLLINAANDPFVPAGSLPAAAPAFGFIERLLVREGGHAGFLEGPWGRRSWAERQALAFVGRHLLAWPSP
jgi:predicted alpha/beta-fold hydrolase